MRVVQELLGLHDRRIRKSGGVELRRQFIDPMKFEDVAKALQQLGPNMNALLVGLQRGVVRQIGPLERFAQRQPLLVADGADEELLAVSERKDVVHAPRGY